MLKNPVAIAFDDHGRLYSVETARRGTVDIDIRAHKDWAIEDLASQSVTSLRTLFRQKMAPELSETNKAWLEDRNGDGSHDWRDLMEVKETVRLIEDLDEDGVADRSSVFYEGFNEEFNGVLAGTLPVGEDVLVTVYPDLWRLRDTDGDRRADERESLFRGFGVHAAFDGHDLHGLCWGPDGKIYFSVGDNGFSVVNREGQRLHYPNTGGVLRMNPDYSGLEVYAYGLRNVQEIAFDNYGNLFSVDNDGDLYNERERFVFIAEGSDSGWRYNWQLRDPGWSRVTEQPLYNPWVDEKMWIPHHDEQPAHITPPISNYSIGPGSFKFNPGTALTEEYQDHFFVIQFPGALVSTFRTEPQGAGFAMIDERTFQSGIMASAINFGPDGALYIADWDGYWQPNDYGAIYRIDHPETRNSPSRIATKEALRTGMAHRSVQNLESLLAAPDQRVRFKAQFELARRRADTALLRIASDETAPILARVHSLWGLGQMGQAASNQSWLKAWPFGSREPKVRAQAAKVAGDLGWGPFGEPLVGLLKDPEPSVVFQAGIAIGKVGGVYSFGPLVEALDANDNRDPFLRHALIQGLVGSAHADAISGLAHHPSEAVRRAAVAALRRIKGPSVGVFLEDDALNVRREAARAIHDDFSIPEALDSLARSLDHEQTWSDEGIARRAISANLRLGGDMNAHRLGRVATNESVPLALREEAILSLAAWYESPFVDRVVGRVRPLGPRDPRIADTVLEQSATQIIKDAPDALISAFLSSLRKRQILPREGILALVADTQRSTELRVEALKTAVSNRSALQARAIQIAMESANASLRNEATIIVSDRDFETLLAIATDTARDWEHPAVRVLLERLESEPDDRADPWLDEMAQALLQGELPSELAVDVTLAAQASASPSVQEKIRDYQGRFPAGAGLGWRAIAALGGDPKRGRQVYEENVSAQCVRCHNAGGDGAQVGPILDGVGTRLDRTALLEALIDPSARIAEGYQYATIKTEDGDVLFGTIVNETDDRLTLRIPDGSEIELPTSETTAVERQRVSAMPPMLEILGLRATRDLVAYLSTL